MTVSNNPFFEDSDGALFSDSDPPIRANTSSTTAGTGVAKKRSPVVSRPSQEDSHHGVSEPTMIDLSTGVTGDDREVTRGVTKLTSATGGIPFDAGGTVVEDSPSNAPPPPFRRSDLFKGTFPISSSEKARLRSCRPVDWSDAFCSDFHLLIDGDPKIWLEICKKFNGVINLDDLQHFISCDLNGMPLMFIGVDHDKKLRLFHNVMIAPDTGSIINPTPSFICLTQMGFDSPPMALVSDKLHSLLISSEYEGIPSVPTIVAECVSDLLLEGQESNQSRPIDVLPDFRLDALKFSNLTVPEASQDENENGGDAVLPQDPTVFEHMGLFPIHPAIAGELLKLFSRFGFGSEKCSPPAIAALIFRFLVKRWARSIGRNEFGKAKTVDLSHPVFSGIMPLFRFLWVATKKPGNLDPVVFDVPSKFEAASKMVRRRVAQAFPDLNSPDRVARARQHNQALPPTPNPNPAVPPTGLPPPTFAGGISPETLLMTEHLSDKLSEAFLRHSTRLSKDKEDEKKDIFKNAIHLKNGILFGQVNENSTTLPTAPTDLALEIFRQKSTHTLHSLIHARVFRKSQNACYTLFSQCGVLQKYGLRWKGDDHPSGLSPFSFDPYNNSGPDSNLSLDSDIQQHIYECSLRQDNGLSTKDMRDIFTNEKLFCPLTCDKYLLQLRSYYLFAVAVWGSSSFIVGQIHKMVEHHITNRRLYRNSQNYDNKFLTQVLFWLDDAVQRYIEDVLEPAECIEDITFDSLEYHTNQLCYKIVSRESVCRMLPRFFLAALNAKSNKVTPNSSTNSGLLGSSANSGSNDSKKRGNNDASNGGSADNTQKRVKFDSPKEWCLPARMKYSKIFVRSVLEKMPTIEIDGEAKPFCNRLLALKSCRNGDKCYFVHADPRDHGKGDEVTAFFKKVYAEAKKQNT